MAQPIEPSGGVGVGAPAWADVTATPAFIETMNNWAKALSDAVNAMPPGVAPPQAPGPAPLNLGAIAEAPAPRDERTASPPGIAAPLVPSAANPAYNQSGYRPTPELYTPEYQAYQRAASTFLRVHPGASLGDANLAALRAVYGDDSTGQALADPNDVNARNPYREKSAEWKSWQVVHDAAIQRPKGPARNLASAAPPASAGGTASPAGTGIVAPREPDLLPFRPGGDVLTFYENDLAVLPEDVRPYVDQVLRQLGYVPTGFFGNYGAREYVRAPGASRIALADDLINRIAGGDLRRAAWLRWFASRKGLYDAPSPYPTTS